jgi:hypothetical protein
MTMDPNGLLGSFLVIVGVGDVALARLFGARLGLTSVARTVLSAGGVALILIGASLVTRRVVLF